jgi:ABC-type lipoprotein export system ATPase subunit
VPQEVQLFGGSIGENIAMGAVDRSFERVVAAAKFVGAHDFIQRLPKGYENRLGERGGGLSAGQRQLISIARAVIRNPRILVLDEATSALDAATEEALFLNLRRASRGRTIVIVTHLDRRSGAVSRRRPHRPGRQARRDRGLDAGPAGARFRAAPASGIGLTCCAARSPTANVTWTSCRTRRV